MVCLFSRRGRDQHGGQIGYGRRTGGGEPSVLRRTAMTTEESAQGSWGEPAGRRQHDKAYFLNLLGDSYTGLGRHEAAIEAYRQAAEEFRCQGAHCSYALCLLQVADATSQSRSRLSHQISRMEKRGLVRRDDCEGDKRGTFAVLTAEGMAAIE